MTRYFVNAYGFLSFAKNGRKNIGKDIRTLAINTVRYFLIMLTNLQQMHLKLLQKEEFQKVQRQLVI